MACNIIMNNAGELRTTQFSFSNIYDIGEINFYVPTPKANSHQVFLVLKNNRNLREIIELTRSKTDAQSNINTLYKVSADSSTRVGEELVEIYLLLINKETGVYFTSSSIKLNLSAEQHKIARQVRAIGEASQKIQECYAKILVLTEANQELYNKNKEGVTQ